MERFPSLIMKTNASLRNRLLVAAILIPVLVLFAWLGGWYFAILIALLTALAVYELWGLFSKNGYKPALALMIVFTPLAVLMRQWIEFRYSDILLAVLILSAMFYHVIELERGGENSAVNFFISLGAPLYLGWLGGYAVSIRNLENGLYWFLLVLIINSMADTGAYAIGSRFGRHKMLPHVSPHKSWEGYAGGIATGVLSGLAVAALGQLFIPGILLLHGALLGLVIPILAPMGDYGESMIKRFFNVKDSSTILLDHGGFLDRIDSALWAVVIGYYLIAIIGG
ncbi:MAG: phosphatidate cytidylyltransferase [Anaerolineaceae bacterium]